MRAIVRSRSARFDPRERNGADRQDSTRVHAVILTRDRTKVLARCRRPPRSPRLKFGDTLTVLDDSCAVTARANAALLAEAARRSTAQLAHLRAEAVTQRDSPGFGRDNGTLAIQGRAKRYCPLEELVSVDFGLRLTRARRCWSTTTYAASTSMPRTSCSMRSIEGLADWSPAHGSAALRSRTPSQDSRTRCVS